MYIYTFWYFRLSIISAAKWCLASRKGRFNHVRSNILSMMPFDVSVDQSGQLQEVKAYCRAMHSNSQQHMHQKNFFVRAGPISERRLGFTVLGCRRLLRIYSIHFRVFFRCSYIRWNYHVPTSSGSLGLASSRSLPTVTTRCCFSVHFRVLRQLREVLIYSKGKFLLLM